jgi:hypothetical protein
VSKAQVLALMAASDLETRGALYGVITDQSHYSRIEPALVFHDYYRFVISYLEQCIIEDPQGECADSRYLAGHDLSGWIVRMFHDPEVPRAVLTEVKSRLAQLYKAGDDGVRDGLLNGTLEHAFEDDAVADFFRDWKSDPALDRVYEQALDWKSGLVEMSRRNADGPLREPE